MGSSPPVKKDIQSVIFQDLDLNLKHATLRFDRKEGKFLLIRNEDPMYKSKSTTDELNRLNEEEKYLTDEIQRKTKIFENLRKKLAELEEKEEKVMKMLKIDVHEKEYFNDLYEKYKKLKLGN